MASDDRKKRKRGFFNLFGGNDELFENIDEMFERMRLEMEDEMERMRSFRLQMDEDRLKQLSQNPNVKVYGYSMRIGPDGKPKFREFGNVKPGEKGLMLRGEEEQESPKEKEGKQEPGREPLVDIFTSNGKTTVIAELPGVEEKDISISLEGKSLEIRVGKGERKYYKKLELPKKFTKKKMKQSYNNGVLELIFS